MNKLYNDYTNDVWMVLPGGVFHCNVTVQDFTHGYLFFLPCMYRVVSGYPVLKAIVN